MFGCFTARSVTAAELLGVDFTSAGSLETDSSYSLGYQFIAKSNLTVSGLAAWDQDQDGFAQPQQVGLWDARQTLMSSAFVESNDPLVGTGGWRAQSITPVTLQAGSTYYVASQGGEGFTWFVKGLAVDGSITFVQDAFHFNGSTANTPLAFPDNTLGLNAEDGGAYFGGNIVLSSSRVPEPGTLALSVLSLAGLLGARLRRGLHRVAWPRG
jgi:hypothetical protein